MTKPKQSPSSNNGLGNLILVDKKRLVQKLSQFQMGVKSKEEVEAVAEVLFEQMRRFNIGLK